MDDSNEKTNLSSKKCTKSQRISLFDFPGRLPRRIEKS